MKRRRDSAPAPEREAHPTLETFERVFDKGVIVVVEDSDAEASVATPPWSREFFKGRDAE